MMLCCMLLFFYYYNFIYIIYKLLFYFIIINNNKKNDEEDTIGDIELVSFRPFLLKAKKSQGTIGTLFLGPVGIAEATAAFAINAEVSLLELAEVLKGKLVDKLLEHDEI